MPLIKLMLVDDFNVIRVGLYELLQAQPDIEVVAEANPGAEAVTLAQTYHPDVVLMDVKMPGINEMEATRQLKACCPAVAILALMIYDSIYEARKHFIHMFDAGASGCILGHATPEDLLQAIRTVHRGRFSWYAVVANGLLKSFLKYRSGDLTADVPSLTIREVLTVLADGLMGRQLGIGLK